jgi:hypothetical protein
VRVRTSIQPTFQGSVWAGFRGDPSNLNYINELDCERNLVLWETLASFNPDTVIEIGSSLGSKLIGFAKANPTINIIGLDINPKAVEKGKKLASEMNLKNLEFRVFDVAKEDISSLEIQSSKLVIFSWATLIYVHPIKIKKVINSVISQKPIAFVFIEQHSANLAWFWKRGRIISGGPNYIRDYLYLINRVDPSSKYQLSSDPITPEIWGPGGGHASMIIGRRTK